MNRREKILLMAFGAAFGVMVIYGLVHGLVLAPGERIAANIAGRRSANAALEQEIVRLRQGVVEYAALRSRTFDANQDKARVLMLSRVNELARRAGLGQDDITCSASNGRVVRDAYREIACNITAGTSLERIVNFLYLLSRDGYLHRLAQVSISPRPNSQDMTLTLRYSTLVLDEPKGVPIPARTTTRPAEPSPSDPQRAAYDVIALRNIFRPYVPRPPVVASVEPTPRPNGVPSGNNSAPPPRNVPPPSGMMVCGLSAVGEEPQIHLADAGRRVGQVYKVGDDLGPGKIVMVDYRRMPRPDDPERVSDSRIILRIKDEFWAVELGQSLNQKRVLKLAELPESLKPRPAADESSTRPADRTQAARTAESG